MIIARPEPDSSPIWEPAPLSLLSASSICTFCTLLLPAAKNVAKYVEKKPDPDLSQICKKIMCAIGCYLNILRSITDNLA